MSAFNLRDWAVGQRILATDLQAFTDRHNAVYPLSFSGNVQVRGALKQGMAVYVPPSPGLPGGLPLLRLQSDAAGDGAYIMRRVKRPTGAISASASVTATNLGDIEDEDVVAWNLDEKDSATHWLTDPANANKTDFQALALFGVDDSGRTIYLIDGSYSDECEETP